ncbi:MAG: response regulator [Pseudomonadales bacterium]
MTRILVVDDHTLVRSGICRMLEDDVRLSVVATAASGEEALRLARQEKVDVVLMDVRMPGMDGIEATRRLIAQNPEVKVIALSACTDDSYTSRIMQAGACGYVTKEQGIEEIVRAVLTVRKGHIYLTPELAQLIALNQIVGAEANPFHSLSEREMQVGLAVVSEEKVHAIADRLHLSNKTVNAYRYRIFEKLGVDCDVGLALLAVRHGLIEP